MLSRRILRDFLYLLSFAYYADRTRWRDTSKYNPILCVASRASGSPLDAKTVRPNGLPVMYPAYFTVKNTQQTDGDFFLCHGFQHF